jgi:branched-subunit amino acid transport protein
VTGAWIAVVLVAFGTWAMRASLVVLFGRVDVPPLLARAFRYVAPSAMAALSIPAFIAPSGGLQVSPPHLLAALAGGLVAWRFHSFLGTLVVGLAVFAVLTRLATG